MLECNDCRKWCIPRAYTHELYQLKCSAAFDHVYESYSERDAGPKITSGIIQPCIIPVIRIFPTTKKAEFVPRMIQLKPDLIWVNVKSSIVRTESVVIRVC
jgi:hypothetical protein